MAVYFTSLEIMKQLYIQKTGKSLGPLQALILGAASRCVSVGLLMPFTVVKTRFEVKTLDIQILNVHSHL